MGANIPESYYKFLGSLPCKQPALMAARNEVEEQANKSLNGSQTRHKGYKAESHFTAGNFKVPVVGGEAGSRHSFIFLGYFAMPQKASR